MAEASTFRVPPEVPRYFADKHLRPEFSWLDVWGQEHAYAFTVAKATDVELLGTIRNSIAAAIDKGQGFEEWRKGLVPELQRIGWGGPRRVADPTGVQPDRVVNFTAPGRLQLIFSANMRSARAAGQWERIQRSKGALPYLLYVRTTSGEPRKQHLLWAGTILPADDAWWGAHFPPNGWNCKCSVRQVSSYERDGLLEEDGYTDEAPPSAERTFVNRRTGEVTTVPDGIDPGWANNPGLSRARTLMQSLEGRLEEAGPAIAARAIGELWRSDTPAVVAAVTTERVRIPVAYAPRVQEALGSKGPLISVSNDTMRTKTGKKDPGSRADFALAQQLAAEGALFQKSSKQGFWAVGWIGKGLWRMAIHKSAGGYLYVSTLGQIAKRELRGTAAPVLAKEPNER